MDCLLLSHMQYYVDRASRAIGDLLSKIKVPHSEITLPSSPIIAITKQKPFELLNIMLIFVMPVLVQRSSQT